MNAACSFAEANADNTGLAQARSTDLRLSIPTPHGRLPCFVSVVGFASYRREKRLTVGSKTAASRAGDTFIIINNVPATGATVQASRNLCLPVPRRVAITGSAAHAWST